MNPCLYSKKTVYAAVLMLCTTLTLFKSSKSYACFASQEEPKQTIQSIDAYNEVQYVFESCNECDLVTFDVDDTLITAYDVIAHTGENDIPLWYKIRLGFKYFPDLLSTATREKIIDEFLNTFLLQVPRYVFDPDIVRFINNLHRQKCPVIGLTSIGSGATSTIKSIPEWRASMLHELGIDFTQTYVDTSLTKLPSKHKTYPCLHKGILCANYINKGDVLEAFLNHYHLRPERIISFDDQIDVLTSIKQVCLKMGIPFCGYLICATKKLPGAWSTKRALLQFDYAISKHAWLTDQQADAIIARQNS
jgi:hypothetical protein